MLLDLKIKRAVEKKLSGYRIYQKDGEPEIVQADTVAEAIEKTTISEPTKIERIGIINKSLFSEEELEEIQESDLQDANSSVENVLMDEQQKYKNVESNTDKTDPTNIVIEESGTKNESDDGAVNMSV